MLKEVLPSIKQLRLLFSSPLDIQNNLALIGDANERKLRNRLTQQFVAKKCEEWFNSHAEIAQTTATALIRQSLFCSEKIAIQGSTELTASGLGFMNPICHDMSIAFDEPEKFRNFRYWSEQTTRRGCRRLVWKRFMRKRISRNSVGTLSASYIFTT